MDYSEYDITIDFIVSHQNIQKISRENRNKINLDKHRIRVVYKTQIL